MAVPPALAECLASYQVKDLPLPKHLVTLEHPKHKLFDAIRFLSHQHLLSAPVLDEEGKLLGTLDTLDIVAHVVEAEAEGKGQLLDKHIDGIMGKVSGAVHTVSLEDNLADVVHMIAGPARRAVVLGADGRPQSVITQSTVIQFLHEKKVFHGRRHRWLAKELCTASAFVISENDTALHAFQTLLEKKSFELGDLGRRWSRAHHGINYRSGAGYRTDGGHVCCAVHPANNKCCAARWRKPFEPYTCSCDLCFS